MQRDEELVSELSEQAAACTECTGLVPAMTETDEENAARTLYAVEKVKRSDRKHDL